MTRFTDFIAFLSGVMASIMLVDIPFILIENPGADWFATMLYLFVGFAVFQTIAVSGCKEVPEFDAIKFLWRFAFGAAVGAMPIVFGFSGWRPGEMKSYIAALMAVSMIGGITIIISAASALATSIIVKTE